MTDGNGIRGLETRQVVQSQGPNGRANQPARQLGQVSVQAPRGGNVNAVGSEGRALAEIAKLGYDGINKHLEKKKAEDAVLGEMDYAEGKTEQELKQAGVSRSRLEGYRALKLKTGYNEWLAQSQANIERGDYAMSSEDYKQKLHSEFRQLVAEVDPSDTASLQLLSSFASEGFGKLVSKHTVANTKYIGEESQQSLSNLIRTEALAGDMESLGELLDASSELVPGLSEEASQGAVFAAMGSLLDEGNFTLFDAVGGLEGMRARGASEEEIGTMRNKLKTAQGINEVANLAEIERGVNDIMLDVKVNGMGREEANFHLENLKETFRLSDSYSRTIINNVNATLNAQEVDEATAAKVYDPEYIQERANLIREIGFDGLSDSNGVNRMLAIADKYEIPHKRVLRDLEALPAAHRAYTDKLDKQLQRVVEKQEAAVELDTKAMTLLNTGFSGMSNYSTEEKQRAMTMKREMIIRNVVENDRFDTDEEKQSEVIRQHVSFLRDTPVKDADIKKDFSIVGQSSPLNEDGTVSVAHLQGFEYLNAMREAGISERTIKEYAGDSYDYLMTASFLSNGELDPKTSLATAWEVTQVPKEDRPTPKTNVAEVLEDWGKTREKFFDSIEPSIISGWTGSASDAKYDEVLSYQVKEVARNSADMDEWVRRKTREYVQAFPSWNKEAIMEKVKRDLSQWEYVMGNMIPPKNGESITEAMGLSEEDGALTSNSAMLMYMRDNSDLLFPKGTAQHSWWESFKAGTGDAIDRAIFEPEKMGIVYANTGKEQPGNALAGKLQGALMAFSEKEQRLANDIKMISIDPLSNGQLLVTLYEDTDRRNPVGVPIPIPAKDIGDWYKVQRKEQQFNKQAPRR